MRKFSFVLLFLFLINPIFAYPYLEADEYVSPSYAYSQTGEIWYEDNAGFVSFYKSEPSYETLGYYPIYDDYDDIDFQITLNTSLAGELFLVVYYNYANTDFYAEAEYSVMNFPSGASSIRVDKEITYSPIWSGDVGYFWKYKSAGNSYYSKYYKIFSKRNLETNWNYYSNVQIASAESMLDNYVRLEINDSDFYDNSLTFYYEDDDLSYTGISTDLVFTNAEVTKAYPYFIDSFKGGYFEVNQNTSNSTFIDLKINEDITAKTLRMFYGYNLLDEDVTVSLYGGNVGMSSDEPNNPYLIFQIFNDYRYSEETFIDLFDLAGDYEDYDREDYLFVSANHIEGYYYFPRNAVNSIVSSAIRTSGSGSSYWTTNLRYYDRENNLSLYANRHYSGGVVDDERLYALNSSYIDTTSFFDSGNTATDKEITSNGTHLCLEAECITYDEATFEINKVYLLSALTSGGQMKSKSIYENLEDITDTVSIGEQTTTEYSQFEEINFNEQTTNHNLFKIGGSFATQTEGTFSCFNNQSVSLGNINIPEQDEKTYYTIHFPYLYNNQSAFLDMNEYEYYCKFTDVNGFDFYTDNLTIPISENKAYITSYKPIYQNKYGGFDVPFQLAGYLNSTDINDLVLRIDEVYCLQTDEDNCLAYSYKNNVLSLFYNEIENSFVYSDYETLENEKYYAFYFQFLEENDSYNSYAAIVPILFSVNFTEADEIDNYIDWNDEEITGDREYMRSKMYDNPFLYFQSFFRSIFSSSSAESGIINIFDVFFVQLMLNPYIWVLIVSSITLLFARNVPFTLIITLLQLIFLSYMGWISLTISMMVIALLGGMLIAVFKR